MTEEEIKAIKIVAELAAYAANDDQGIDLKTAQLAYRAAQEAEKEKEK